MMGSGKSTIGRLLAEKLKWKFLDSDTLIEQKEKKSIAQIFAEKGENAFREIETEVIRVLSSQDNCVIACGGGAPCLEENWKSLSKNGYIIWLRVSAKKLLERLKNCQGGIRPLLKDSNLNLKKIETLLQEREFFYAKAHRTLAVENLAPEEATGEILKLLKKEETNLR